MRYHVNYTIAIVSSNQQILWETRKVRLTEKKKVGSNIAKSTCSCSSYAYDFLSFNLVKAHTEPEKIDSKCSKIT